jgi:hypothetical protein
LKREWGFKLDKGAAMKRSEEISVVQKIERVILIIRGQKVMIDRDLAELYGVETKQLCAEIVAVSLRISCLSLPKRSKVL